jgi:LPXTG-motif cell wall-anchored protein
MGVTRLTAIMAISAGLTVFAQTGPALACSCVTSSLGDQVDRAGVVATGTLAVIADPSGGSVVSSTAPIRYMVDVDAVYKGRPAAQLSFVSARFGASCGLEGMRADRRYVFFLLGDHEDGLSADLCGGTAPTSAHLQSGLEQLTGPPTQVAEVETGVTDSPARGPGHDAVDEATGDASSTAIWLGLLGVAAVGGGGGLIWWRRRSS